MIFKNEGISGFDMEGSFKVTIKKLIFIFDYFFGISFGISFIYLF